MDHIEHWRLWLSELRRWVTACCEQKPEWQVEAFGHWFCPYTGRAVACSSDDIEARIDHLVDNCPQFTEIGDPTRFDANQLVRASMLVLVKKRMPSSAAWQMRDEQGFWICPYCAEASDVQISGKVDKAVLGGIVDVITACPAFQERGHDGFLSADEISQSSAKAKMVQESIDELTSWMTDD